MKTDTPVNATTVDSPVDDAPQTKPEPGPIDLVTQELTPLEKQARFDQYVTPELDFVHRVTNRMSRSKVDAEDLSQEVLSNAYRSIARFDGRYPRAWLYRIASNAATSRARKKRVAVTLLESDQPGSQEFVAEGPGPEEIVISPIVDPVLTNALDSLPNHYREVVDLVDVDGMTYEAAASHLDIPTGTVMSRLHRGRRRLRDDIAGTHLDRSGRHAFNTSVPV